MPIRILLADDHEVVRDGVRALLEKQADMEVIGEASDGREAARLAEELRPDVVVMDVGMPNLNGIDATRRILSELPEIRIIALSRCHTSKQVCRALRAGARGYVLKTASSYELLSAIRAVTSGQQYVSPSIAVLMADGVLGSSIPASPFETLSAREHVVLQHIIGGATSSDIARHLSLSRKTVDTYRGRLMVKLGVDNRSALIRCAIENELIPL